MEHRCGSCRICVVEVTGRPNLAPSCCTPVAEGMDVHTNTSRAIRARRTMLELLLSNHPKDCLVCSKNQECELQRLASAFNIHHIKYEGAQSEFPVDENGAAIRRDMSKCIMCRRCETACNVIQTVGVSPASTRLQRQCRPENFAQLTNTACTFCGQCVLACPVGALTEIGYKDESGNLNNRKTVIVQTAPQFALPSAKNSVATR